MIKYKLGCDILKTRIFVSSRTNINYVKHDSSIEVLNDIISFHSYEDYVDYVDMNDQDFYIRCKNDSTANPTFSSIPYDYLILRIEKAVKDKVEKIVFIINDNEFELIKKIEDAISEKNDLDITLLKTKLLLYPFDYAVLEANKEFKKDGDIEKLEAKLKDVEDRFKLYFFSPERDILPNISKIDFDDDVLGEKRGTLYDCNKSGVVLLKKYKNRYPFEYLLNAIIKETAYLNVIPFIHYSDQHSKFVYKLEKEYLNKKPNTKIIKEVLPAYYGNIYGINTLVIGFIMK